MKKTLRVLTAPARLGQHPGSPTLYRVRRCDGSPGGSECEVVETDLDGGDVIWPETFPGPHAAEGGIYHLTTPEDA